VLDAPSLNWFAGSAADKGGAHLQRPNAAENPRATASFSLPTGLVEEYGLN